MQISKLLPTELARSWRRLVVLGLAIAGSVALFVVLGGLGLGLYSGVISPLLPRLPLSLLKVEPRALSVGLLSFSAADLTSGLDDRTIERLRRIEGVDAVFPIVGAAFPMRAEGGEGFLGKRLYTDLFATGLDPALVAEDVAPGHRFAMPGEGEPVPVLVARRLLDLYNTTVASAIDKPRLSSEAVIGFEFELVLGASYARGAKDPSRIERRVAQIVGLSEKANLVGITVPEPLLRDWNRAWGVAKSPLSGAFVRCRDPEQVGLASMAIERLGLRVDDTPKLVGTVITVGTVLGIVVGSIVIGLVAFAIAQAFFLLVRERRFELAILRAVGARARDLRRLVLLEAALVGLCGAVAGVALGAVVLLALEAWLLRSLPDLPVPIDHVVTFSPGLLASAIVVGMLASLVGAYVPSMLAGREDPAVLLRS